MAQTFIKERGLAQPLQLRTDIMSFRLATISRPLFFLSGSFHSRSRLEALKMSVNMRRRDTETLARLGKRQVLKRRFYFWSLFAFAVCELITWESVLALFAEGLRNGGPAGLIYGYIFAWVSTMYVSSLS